MAAPLPPETFREIERLLTEWAYLIDHGRAAEVVDLFTQDGVFESAGLRSSGAAALRERFERRQARQRTARHVWSNLRLVALAPDQLQGEALLTVYRHDGPGVGRPVPTLVLDLVDRYQRVDGRWLIAARTLTPVFCEPTTV